MSDQLKVRLISAANTFTTAFLLTIATSISMVGVIEWTTAFWVGIAMAGVRAGIAELVKSFTPVKLGGRKKV